MLGPLIDVHRLARRIDEPRTRIADVRWYLTDPGQGWTEFREGHIPGAVFVDLDVDLSAPEGHGRHPLPQPSDFTNTLGRLGFSRDDDIVVYDSAGGGVAARMWWMLRSILHPSVAVLDGGFPAWKAAGYPISTELVMLDAVGYPTAERWIGTVDLEHIRRHMGKATLVDARAGERYRGESEPVDPRAGHIPTAQNVPFSENLDEEGRLLPPDRLRARLGMLTQESIVYCGSGVNACHHVLAAEVAGLPAPLLYPGSWSDWSSRPDTEAATGPQP